MIEKLIVQNQLAMLGYSHIALGLEDGFETSVDHGGYKWHVS